MVEGLNNKIRVIQRSAYGYRDEDYLRLKVIASFLPPLPETPDCTHTDPRRPQKTGRIRGSKPVSCEGVEPPKGRPD